ncbi:MAG TPA: lasso peptide biosynthesis B2 protein [Candidatus Sulfotelmatobacter sp.]|nr:lasso peptide biosynthesis B2 protein [Candidatus Sulfotelmatobacter sp.]
MELTKHTEQKCDTLELVPERGKRLPARLVLILDAYLSLIRFDLYLARKDFKSLYSEVRNYPTRKRAASPGEVEVICSAVDMACIWYWKEALCLQRSAATVCLLRKYGVSAHLVIGAQQMPFKAHAWVEVDGKVVNDKKYVPEMYGILTRC